MQHFPDAVLAYIETYLQTSANWAFLRMSPSQEILEAGGSLRKCGIYLTEDQKEFTRPLFFLEGLLPLTDSNALQLQYIQQGKRWVHVHIFPASEHEFWVLFKDVTKQYFAKRKAQQKINELNLWRDQMSRYDLATHSLNHQQLQTQMHDHYDNRSHCLATVMVVHIASMVELMEEAQEQVVLQEIATFLRQAKIQITDENGWIEYWQANGFQVVFGLLPPFDDSRQRAEIAAQRILNIKKTFSPSSYFTLGIGIATGMMSAGVMNYGTHERFSPFGVPFLRAQRLALKALSDQFLSEEVQSSHI